MLTYPQIDPVALQLGPLAIHWYGLMYVVAFSACYAISVWRSKNYQSSNPRHPFAQWTSEQVGDMMFFIMIGVIFGGRVGYFLFYQSPETYLKDPLQIIMIQNGGMSFHGGAIGVGLGLLYFARKTKKSFLEITDFVAATAPLGLAFGRIGNFINGELWGRVTSSDFPLAMIFPHVDQLPRHPSQLYQMLLEGFLLFGILWWYSSKPKSPGQVTGVFLVGYGIARFVVEFVRQPDAHLSFIAFNWLTMGHLLSVPMVLAGGFMIYLCKKQTQQAT